MLHARVVNQYFGLPEVPWPTTISPYRTASATDDFEAAAIRIVEYGDPLCSDCRYLHEQLGRLKEEFAGHLNVAFQFFPLEAKCNDVVDKDKHPGACELSYMAAYDAEKFGTIIDEIFANFEDAKTPEWRAELARRHGDIEIDIHAAAAAGVLAVPVPVAGPEHHGNAGAVGFGIEPEHFQ